MGSSKSTSASTNEQKDNRGVIEGNGLMATDGSTINFETLDGEMVNAALAAITTTTGRSLDTVDRGIVQNSEVVDAALKFAQGINDQALRRVDDAQFLVARDSQARQSSDAEKLIESWSSANNKTLLIAGAAAVAVGMAFIYKR